mmetsp:Transcript_338/g.804  ORF Transcript_338/g.804 Transcript_338/m.804 type:complete len:251 (-) Transcript_338:12-764(-)
MGGITPLMCSVQILGDMVLSPHSAVTACSARFFFRSASTPALLHCGGWGSDGCLRMLRHQSFRIATPPLACLDVALMTKAEEEPCSNIHFRPSMRPVRTMRPMWWVQPLQTVQLGLCGSGPWGLSPWRSWNQGNSPHCCSFLLLRSSPRFSARAPPRASPCPEMSGNSNIVALAHGSSALSTSRQSSLGAAPLAAAIILRARGLSPSPNSRRLLGRLFMTVSHGSPSTWQRLQKLQSFTCGTPSSGGKRS